MMSWSSLSSLKPSFKQILCFIAIFLNLLLILVIMTKSPPKMGTYRYLMCYFCLISIMFAGLEIVVEPEIRAHGCAFFMTMDLRKRNMDARVGRLLVCILCACCGVIMYGIAIHFVYRFFALEREGRLKYFKGFYLLLWLIIPIVVGVNWVLLCWILLSMHPFTNAYLKPVLEEVFHIPIEKAVYSGAVFWPFDSEGKEYFNWYSGAALINLMVTMGFAFLVVIVMGVKSYMKIRVLLIQGESTFARNLQMQLYKALVAQTIIPVLLLFIPVGILFIGPLLRINCEFLSSPITFIYAFYPALDPLPTLYFVDNYRNAITESLCCCFEGCKKNSVQPSDHGVQEENNENS